MSVSHNPESDQLPAEATLQPTASAKTTLPHKTFKDGAIYLFIRSDYSKPTWFCRLKIPGSVSYIYRSTRSTNEHEAYAFAEKLYNQALVRTLTGEAANPKRLGSIIDGYIQTLDGSSSQADHNKVLLLKRLRPFLQGRTTNEITTVLVSDINAELVRLSSKNRLSPNTVRRANSDLKHFFGWCVSRGYIPSTPAFPKIAGDAARRTHFDAADWRKLVRYLREFIKIENKAVRRDRTMLINYVLILGNTGIRVGEARTLKWRDVRQIGKNDGKVDVILAVTGKTGPREVVARTPDVKTYLQRIYKLRQAELATDEKPEATVYPDSLIFCHRDGTEIGSFKKSFQSLICAAGVETDSYGQKRTIYSLRHTYATFRLHEGVHQFTLARNMGTSVAMLEKYYGHTSNITSADELTKTTTRRQVGGNSSALDWLQ